MGGKKNLFLIATHSTEMLFLLLFTNSHVKELCRMHAVQVIYHVQRGNLFLKWFSQANYMKLFQCTITK